MNTKAWATAAALLAAGAAQATCYSVYKADGALILESSTPPVNLTQLLGDSVPEKFGPGATMTVSDVGTFCRDRRGDDPLLQPAAQAAPPAQEKGTEVALKQPAASAQPAATVTR